MPVYTKEDIARAEIHAAIRIFVQMEDLISAHVLASAAAEVGDAIAREDGKPTLFQQMLDSIRPEFKRTFRDLHNKAYNAFKHADRDAEQAVELKAEQVELAIFLAIENFALAFGFKKQSVQMLLLRSWFWVRYPEFLEKPLKGADALKEFFGDVRGKPTAEAVIQIRRMLQTAEGDKTLLAAMNAMMQQQMTAVGRDG